ncbi:MAG: hypothetical protein VX260_03300, partial [Candidatus Neomarinimicrobiota bacterium]|nr:hypothetical protein [Candidatus Neomarinimicrobiota bacterium]
MKQYIKISIVYILCPFLFAQKIPVNPDHNVYPYLYRQSTNGILPQWIQSVRPLTIDQVLSLLNEVKENDEINNGTRILAEQFISEFISPKNSGIKLPFSKKNKLNQLLSYNINDIEPHLLSIKNDSSSLWIDWSEDLVMSSSNDYHMYFRDNISLKTIISKQISAYTQFSMNRLVWKNNGKIIESVLPPDTIDWYDYNNEWAKYFPEVKSIFWYNSQAGISIDFDKLNFNLGRQNHSWGWSTNSSPILSGDGMPLSYIGLQINFDKIRFRSLHGSLMPFSPYEMHKRVYNPSKYIAAHRGEIDITNNFTISITELAIYGNRNIDLDYLNPVHWYWAVEHNTGDRDNLLIGIDYSWRIRPNMRIYQTMLLDEITWSKLFKPWWGNKFIFQSGLHFIPSSNPSIPDIRIEYTISRPWIYSHKDSINTFSSANIS